MDIKQLHDNISVSAQIHVGDVAELARLGFRSIVCNRPDGEAGDQPLFEEIRAAAEEQGVRAAYLPVESGAVRDADVAQFDAALADLPGPVLAFCRTGTRSVALWSLANARRLPPDDILAAAKGAGFDMGGVIRRFANQGRTPTNGADASYDVVIVGAGAAGISVASSLQRRNRDLSIGLIDPADIHYYQPGWTLVGGGVFDAAETVRTMASVIPKGVHWLKAAVAAFEPDRNVVVLDGCRRVSYHHLVVCPGLKLDWHRVDGLVETLGKNGVTSNYRFDLAPYTWRLIQGMNRGKALFTQPPMPIKCAGAPQKAMYLAADAWRRRGCLDSMEIDFLNAGAVLFGVKEFVPSLMKYVESYGINLDLGHNLVAVDGQSKNAWFDVTDADGNTARVERSFDMMHVCPPQSAPDFVRVSPLADEAGWMDVDQITLRHKRFENVYGLGDVINAPNAKTAAAARKQAPVVAQNIFHDLVDGEGVAHYDGYGSCPLTVERGKIVLAEFGYGGKLLPSFPRWMLDGTKPSQLAWLLKERILPPLYWKGMLKGREWMVRPESVE